MLNNSACSVIAELSNTTVELPPELCVIFMSPISISIIYSFSLIPSIMHRIESLLLAVNLKNIHLNYCKQNDIPTFKVLIFTYDIFINP